MGTGLGAFEIIVWGVVTFSILVVLHEMGHFLAARAFGVKVHEFMVGLPGPALRLRTKNMTWGVTAVPLGGYVRIAGMEPGADDALLGPALGHVRAHMSADASTLARALDIPLQRAEALLTSLADWKAVTEDGERYVFAVEGHTAAMSAEELLSHARSFTYRGQAAWKRVVILGMGVFTNLAVAIATFTVVLSVWGYYDFSTRIDSVVDGSPAEAAGIVPGDVLVAVGGAPIERWDEFQMAMSRTKPGDSVVVTFERDGASRDVSLVLAERDGHGFAGLGPTAVAVRPSVIESVGESFRYTGLVFRAIAGFFNPSTFQQSIGQSAGVVGISVMAAEAVDAGPLSYATLIALLSLSLGVMNILPLPPLDGGKIALEVIERAIGRPLDRRITLALNGAGAVLLFTFIGYIMFVDISRIAG